MVIGLSGGIKRLFLKISFFLCFPCTFLVKYQRRTKEEPKNIERTSHDKKCVFLRFRAPLPDMASTCCNSNLVCYWNVDIVIFVS